MSTFIPNSDRVLVKLQPLVKKSGSIIIPDSAHDDSSRTGVVVSVGAGRYIDGKLIRPDIDPNDVVVIDNIGGLELKIDGEKFLLVRFEEILGRFVV